MEGERAIVRAAVRTTLFHVASLKENYCHYLQCPEEKNSWHKFHQY